VQIGAGSKIGSHTVIEGHTTLGIENTIAHFAAIGGSPQDMKYRGEPTRLQIGDRNTIREFTTIHTGTAQDDGITQLGNDNWIMAYVHIAHMIGPLWAACRACISLFVLASMPCSAALQPWYKTSHHL
jgi:UDP-N-acetylglucosamine acyltransferase